MYPPPAIRRSNGDVLTKLLDEDRAKVSINMQHAESLMRENDDILGGSAMQCPTCDRWEQAGSRNVNPNLRPGMRFRLLWWEAYRKVAIQNRVRQEMSRAWIR